MSRLICIVLYASSKSTLDHSRIVILHVKYIFLRPQHRFDVRRDAIRGSNSSSRGLHAEECGHLNGSNILSKLDEGVGLISHDRLERMTMDTEYGGFGKRIVRYM